MNCCFPISKLDDSDFNDTFNGCNSIDLPVLPYDMSYEFPKPNRGLKIGHLNINGLFGKLDSLSFLIHSLNLDVLFISETHLNINQEYPSLLIDGHKIEIEFGEELDVSTKTVLGSIYLKLTKSHVTNSNFLPV
jgi:hypothetical protein